MKNNQILILKTIVGSVAHGLATEASDTDYRGVFAVPTKEILSLGYKPHPTDWIEGKDDNTSWEIGHFLHLATHCNPTILETFLAPVVKQAPDNPVISPNSNDGRLVQLDFLAYELRALFPYIWNSAGVMNAFIGYGLNQRKKFFDDKDKRASKYAVAYLRTLYQAWELLATGTFTIKIADTEIGETLKKWKALASSEILLNYSGEVIELCLKWERKVKEAYEKNPNKQTEIEPINNFLLKVRKEFWE